MGGAKPIERLRDLIDSFETARGAKPVGPFIFRGQRANWTLKTSLELACERMETGANPLARALEHEAYFLREFQRRAHHYLSDLPSPQHKLEWLALMRHHGAPSRLLDSTYSIYVATYFAIQHSESDKDADAAIWMFDRDWCFKEAARLATQATHGGANLLPPTTYENEEQKASILLSEHTPFRCVSPVNPFRLNERLTIQRGVFLVPGDVSHSFEENLNTMPKQDANVTKFLIPRKSFRAISVELHSMNVSEATLFPGLDGYARSLIAARRFIDDQRPASS